MSRSMSLVLGGAGCLAITIAGLIKAFDGELPMGLLLVGLSMSLFGNVRCVTTHIAERSVAA